MTTNRNQPSYTGDIAEQHIDPSQEYSTENQEIVFSEDQHAIWADLYAGIHQPYLLEHICQEFKNGLALLDLDRLYGHLQTGNTRDAVAYGVSTSARTITSGRREISANGRSPSPSSSPGSATDCASTITSTCPSMLGAV